MKKRIRIILKYLKHFIFSKNIHAIHGPFIFDFISTIFKKHANECQEPEQLREALLQDKRIINIIDFGAGSSINKDQKRTIQDIAKNSAKNKKCGRILYNITKHFKPETMIELGTSLGVSSTYIAKGNPKGILYTFEGCPETAKIAGENFSKTPRN